MLREELADAQVMFLQKPFLPVTLGRKLRDVLDGSGLPQRRRAFSQRAPGQIAPAGVGPQVRRPPPMPWQALCAAG